MVESGKSTIKLPLGPTEERTRSPLGQAAAALLVILAIVVSLTPAPMGVRLAIAGKLQRPIGNLKLAGWGRRAIAGRDFRLDPQTRRWPNLVLVELIIGQR